MSRSGNLTSVVANSTPRRLFSILLIGLLITPLLVKSQEEVVIGKTYNIHSEILNEDRKYSVYLPASYNDPNFSPKDYMVMYLLDGDMHFASTSGMIHHMTAGINGNYQIPEMIIVAIHNIGGIRLRRRDLTTTERPNVFPLSGGGKKFMGFIEKEIIPTIENRYRTMNYRLLVGHSLGGLMALDSFLDDKSPYDAFISLDPSIWWDNMEVLNRAKKQLPDTPDNHRAVYIATANNGPQGNTMVQMAKDFNATIKEQQHLVNVRSQFEFFEKENHGAVPLIALYKGLQFIFEGYQNPYTLFGQGLQAVTNHYQSFSNKLGVDIPAPEHIVFSNAAGMIRTKPELAISLFELNKENYPGSFRNYLGLANAYKFKGDTTAAIMNFKKVLELKPDHAGAKRQLELLK